MRQVVVVVVADGATMFEVGIPLGVWSTQHWPGPSPELIVATVDGTSAELSDPSLRLDGLRPLASVIAEATTVIVPTWPATRPDVPEELGRQLREANQRGTRIVGLCLGAYVVAMSGLLDNRTAVTHWNRRHQFAEQFPAVRFEADPLYIDHGSVVTSAGSAAALDCCLHLVRSDHGAEIAAAVARSMVTAPHRSGGQSQFATAPVLVTGSELRDGLARASLDIGNINSVGDLAAVSGLSRRTLGRRMADELAVTPREWIAQQRVTTACRLLESSDTPVEVIASTAGFGSGAALRREMFRQLATTPTAYRQAFKAI